jgi:hypothetical protein
MTLAYSSTSAGKPCTGCTKFPTYIHYNAHGIQIAAQRRQGHAIVSLNTVTRAIHIQLLARQIHNTRTLPTTVATCPARLRRSLHARLCRSLPAVALLFSSPTAPYVTTVMRTRLLACKRMCSWPTQRRLMRIRRRRPQPWRWAGHLRTQADVDLAPPTITRTTTSFGTEVSLAWTPNALSLLGHQIWYTFMSMWIRETCLDSSSLIDWLWIWWMDFVAPSLFE